jgi:ferredoxin
MAGGGYRVVVDRTKCIGSGQCVAHAGAVFDQSEDDGTVVLLMAEPPAPLRAAIDKAARLCPAQAISVVESG